MKRAFHAILRSALVAGATTGGSPCGDPCTQIPESRSLVPVHARDAGVMTEAGSDASADAEVTDAAVLDAAIADAGSADAYAAYVLADGGLDCRQLCHAYSPATLSCAPAELPDAAPAVECIEGPHTECSGSGRAHAAVTPATFATRRDVEGRWLATAAAGEAGSVLAFRRLRAECKRIGAPRSLLRALSRAARDEERHARAVFGLARAAGASALSPPRLRPLARDLEALAIENAVEGCVNETYGAVLAAWQATHARDARSRAAFARIAPDEARHAELAWKLARFMEMRLGKDARARVTAARRDAFARLRRRVTSASPVLVARGLAPDAAVAGAMVAALEAALA